MSISLSIELDTQVRLPGEGTDHRKEGKEDGDINDNAGTEEVEQEVGIRKQDT